MAITDIDGERIRSDLRRAMIESMTKGSICEHPYLELKNAESGDVLYRADIRVYEHSDRVNIYPLQQELLPLKAGFADKLTIVNRDNAPAWSMTPATRKAVTELIPVADYKGGDYQEFLATVEKIEKAYYLPPEDGFIVTTPECPSIEESWRDGGYQLHPNQPISVMLPSFVIR